MNVSIIGAGRVGCSLLRYAKSAGCSPFAVVTRDPIKGGSLREEFGALHSVTDPSRMPEGSDLVLITVPDYAIADVVSAYARTNAELLNVLVAHTSGLRSPDVLRPLAARGAVTGVMHPIQSFASGRLHPSVLRGIGCGISGRGDFEARILEVTKMFQWNAVRIPDDGRNLYHAACVFAGNFLTALSADASTLMERATGERDSLKLLLPMMRHILDVLDSTNPRNAITGPAARGDEVAMDKHMEALAEQAPEMLEVYWEMTERIRSMVGGE